MTEVRPGEVLEAGKHYKIKYRDALEAGATKTFTGEFVQYIEADDLCIFHEDNMAHVPKAIVWSTEMLVVEKLPAGD